MSRESASMSKRELIQILARKTGATKRTATDVMEAFQDLVVAELQAGNSVTLTSFGTFFTAERAPRKGINPNTGDSLDIPAMELPRFRAGAAFKAAVRAKDSSKG